MSSNRKIAKYAVEKIDGTVKRNKMTYDVKNGGLKATIVEQDAGYMVYLPNGNSYRARNDQELKAQGFNVPAPIIDEALDGEAIPGEFATAESVDEMKKVVVCPRHLEIH